MLLGAVLFFIFIVQLIAIRCWRRRINRLYYEEQRELKEAEEAARMEAAIRDFDASLVRLVIRREADTLDADADKEESSSGGLSVSQFSVESFSTASPAKPRFRSWPFSFPLPGQHLSLPPSPPPSPPQLRRNQQRGTEDVGHGLTLAHVYRSESANATAPEALQPHQARVHRESALPRHKPKKKARFVPFPPIFVFPNLYDVALDVLAIGLVQTSVELLATRRVPHSCTSNEDSAAISPFVIRPACGLACCWPAIATLCAIGLYTVLALAEVLCFYYCRGGRKLWVPTRRELIRRDARKQRKNVGLKAASKVLDRRGEVSVKTVEDPVMRRIQKACRCGRKKSGQEDHLLDRESGYFEFDEEEVAEPARTERLLAKPFCLFRSRAADMHTSLSTLLLGRSSGGSLMHITYDWLFLFVQILLAVILGFGPMLDMGSDAANAQIGIVISVQFGLALFFYVIAPGTDRLEVAVQATQIFCEGVGTTLTMSNLGDTALAVGLTAIFLPVALQLYDALIVKVIARVHGKEKVTCKEWGWAFLSVLATVPEALGAMVGVDCGALVTACTESCMEAREDATAEEEGEEEEERGGQAETRAWAGLREARLHDLEESRAACSRRSSALADLRAARLHDMEEARAAVLEEALVPEVDEEEGANRSHPSSLRGGEGEQSPPNTGRESGQPHALSKGMG